MQSKEYSMTVLQAWKDSLNLCRPAALKFMFLVTLNAMKEVLRVLGTSWFLIPTIFLLLLSFLFDSFFCASLTYTFIAMCILLAARPSIRIKNGSYFREYFVKYAWFVTVATFWGLVLVSICGGTFFIYNPLISGNDLFFGFGILAFFSTLFGATGLSYYAKFFYLDGVGSVWISFKKALVLITYNLPMLSVYSVITFLIKCMYWILVTMIFGQLSWSENLLWYMLKPAGHSGLDYNLLGLLPYLFSVCLFANIYTKRVHDQYSLYQ
jgi:hypothetical protein